jgi:hypothetical protein
LNFGYFGPISKLQCSCGFADLEAGPVLLNALTRAMDNLTARGFVLAEDVGNVHVAAIEYLVQQKGGPLFRRQTFIVTLHSASCLRPHAVWTQS